MFVSLYKLITLSIHHAKGTIKSGWDDSSVIKISFHVYMYRCGFVLMFSTGRKQLRRRGGRYETESGPIYREDMRKETVG